jgi:hypothetical protein
MWIRSVSRIFGARAGAGVRSSDEALVDTRRRNSVECWLSGPPSSSRFGLSPGALPHSRGSDLFPLQDERLYGDSGISRARRSSRHGTARHASRNVPFSRARRPCECVPAFTARRRVARARGGRGGVRRCHGRTSVVAALESVDVPGIRWGFSPRAMASSTAGLAPPGS